MKKNLPLLAIALLAQLFSACSSGDKNLKNITDEAVMSLNSNNLTLTDDLVVKYIDTYKKLKVAGPEMLNKMNQMHVNVEENLHASVQEYNSFEKTLKESGFKDYPEFVKTNAKIAWAFSISQAGTFMNDMQKMKDNGLEQIEQQLNDPNVSKETKAELQKAKEEIISRYSENDKWANVSLDVVKNLVSDEDVAVIKRHQPQLLEVFTSKN